MLDRLARKHEVRACYEASGAGYVLERMIRSWGHKCEIVAPPASTASERAAQTRRQGRGGTGTAVPGGGAGDDPGADGAGGAGARPDALPEGVSARGPEVETLHPEVSGAAQVGCSGKSRNWTGKHFAWLRAIRRWLAVTVASIAVLPSASQRRTASPTSAGHSPRERAFRRICRDLWTRRTAPPATPAMVNTPPDGARQRRAVRTTTTQPLVGQGN